jgi:hypothetical protein
MTAYPDGTLIKASDPEVDIVKYLEGKEKRRWVPDVSIYNKMGFQSSNIQRIRDALRNYRRQWTHDTGVAFATLLVSALIFFSVGDAAAQTFNQIQFVIGTGNDDLRGDSSATATLQGPSGEQLQVITLKTQRDPGWANNTIHTVTAGLNPPLSLSAIRAITITLTSHDSTFETPDNWNVQSVEVALSNNGGGQATILSASSAPLARLTHSQPSFTLSMPPIGPAGTFNQIQFVIETGDDDLRSDSSATATLEGPSGEQLQVITLKTQRDPGWDNNTTHTITGALNPPLRLSAIRAITITLTSHDSTLETPDNWNVQSVDVALSNNGGGQAGILSANRAPQPLARLTHSQPSFRLSLLPIGPAGTFNQIQFVIGTGDDDLRGDSSATATLRPIDGSTLQTLALKNQTDPGWGNNTTNKMTFDLNAPRTPAQVGVIVITMTSHNSSTETDDNWNIQNVQATLSNNGVGPMQLVSRSGNPLARLTAKSPSLVVLDNLQPFPNVLGPQPGTGRLRGFVDLHTHPLANLGFGGVLVYGGNDVGSLLPIDPDGNHNVHATRMEQALGNDNSTHGGPGLDNPTGDVIRNNVINTLQSGQAPPNIPIPSTGAPDFPQWPVWNDITHQKMWVDWIRRSYDGGLRVMVALAVNNQTLADLVAGPGNLPTDDKSSADLQLTEIKKLVGRHADFMEIALTAADLERIIRANKLAVVLGTEIDNIGNFNKVTPLTNAMVSAEIDRLFNEGVRYIFPIHLIDNPFGGTAAYTDLFNYSNFRESGHWWKLTCTTDPSEQINYSFTGTGFDPFAVAAEATKLGVSFATSIPPQYPLCSTGQKNTIPLTLAGRFAVKEMMRHGMFIDIDHMSEGAQDMTIAIAKGPGANGSPLNYPLNSGHSGLRSFFVPPLQLETPDDIIRKTDDESERSMNVARYEEISKLHGMAGIGSAGINANQWAAMYQEVINVMGNGAIAGFGTDTNGVAPGMPPDSTEAKHLNALPGAKGNPPINYGSSFPRSSLGTHWWDYNTDGVAHYGMLPDFLLDVRAIRTTFHCSLNGSNLDVPVDGAKLIDENLMYGVDYFLETWKKCEAASGNVGSN